MVFNRLFGKLFGGWPSDVPRLYPHIDDLQLSQFLSDEDYERIRSFPNVYILPFWSEEGDHDEDCFGIGLSRLMIRNLMLLRDVSIHGSEDTPMVSYESGKEITAESRKSCYVSGRVAIGPPGYTLQVDIHRPGRELVNFLVRESNFAKFLRECAAAIGRGLGSCLQTTVADAWEVGQPKDAASLQRCGSLSLPFEPDDKVAKSRAVREDLAADPGFVVPIWELEEEGAGARRANLEGLKRDPYNAQLCFLTFCTLWNSKGPQPDAMQFCRKAIELSPGHGKAHMCAPHAAHVQADMLHHSELGYRLLPGNPFAVNNYTIYLRQIGASHDKLLELANEGIALDPCDPGNYWQAIDVCWQMGAYREALQVAERLQELFEPEIDERTAYCIRQNPERARLFDSGQYDPAAENRRLIADLRRQASGQ